MSITYRFVFLGYYQQPGIFQPIDLDAEEPTDVPAKKEKSMKSRSSLPCGEVSFDTIQSCK